MQQCSEHTLLTSSTVGRWVSPFTKGWLGHHSGIHGCLLWSAGSDIGCVVSYNLWNFFCVEDTVCDFKHYNICGSLIFDSFAMLNPTTEFSDGLSAAPMRAGSQSRFSSYVGFLETRKILRCKDVVLCLLPSVHFSELWRTVCSWFRGKCPASLHTFLHVF